MSDRHMVRTGIMGLLGTYRTEESVSYPRGSRVIVRTERGLETGEVLELAPPEATSEGTILRPVTVGDELLLARLEKNRQAAFEACTQLLTERGVEAVLMEVEQLFDGESLYFYFLGDPPPEAETLSAELAEAYETKVRFRRFAEAVNQGCGPTCGTVEGAGKSCGSCASGCGSGGCGS